MLNNVIKNLNSRMVSINKLINKNEYDFKKKIFELEEDKESYLKDEENLRKYKKDKNINIYNIVSITCSNIKEGKNIYSA